MFGHHPRDVDPPEGVAAFWCPNASRESCICLVKRGKFNLRKLSLECGFMFVIYADIMVDAAHCIVSEAIAAQFLVVNKIFSIQGWPA